MGGTEAVFFDVDFTLIHPGPRFQGAGYQASCARRGVSVDISRFEAAVAGAADVLASSDQLYNDGELFVRYTARIINLMGGHGPDVRIVARELYDDWAEHHHFSLYDDVKETLTGLAEQNLRLGLISNSQRCLASFQSHFDLDGLISATVSSSECGFMKPHPAIFRAALELVQVPADRAVMVGDSLLHDVEGARQVGMRGVWLTRGGVAEMPPLEISTIQSLRELPDLLVVHADR